MELFSAILADDLQAVALLLTNPLARPYNSRVFGTLCERRRIKMLRLLLNDMRVYPPQADADPIFMTAVQARDLEVVSLLMDSEKFEVPVKAINWARAKEDDQMCRLLSRSKIRG